MIQIRGARTHNLKNIDLDIPQGALTVITGVSGSGKSSLAFGTLFAEGQRQYVESMSIQVRQSLIALPRPDVDSIAGLQPTLCIDQYRRAPNPRSTVGTTTEIYDYLRLMMARCGQPHCYACGHPILQQTSGQIEDAILAMPHETRLLVLAPMVRGKRGSHRDVIQRIRKAGLLRLRADGTMYELEAPPELDPNTDHAIDAIVDRIVLRDGCQQRVTEAVQLALRLSEGTVAVSFQIEEGEWQERLFSTRYACAHCGVSYEELEPRTFSFNSPYGACSECRGVGHIQVEDSNQGNVDGEEEPVVAPSTRRVCTSCHGTRLRPEALGVRVGNWNIAELANMPLSNLLEFLQETQWEASQQPIAGPLVTAMIHRLHFLNHVGVGYLSLDRTVDTLSGGEMQRVRLATGIGSGLTGVCYVLDEPSSGLHPRDNARLIESIRGLQKSGNTVVVVEHDEEIMAESDWLVDIGPFAGIYGGEVVAAGSFDEVKASSQSLTASYLNGTKRVETPAKRRKPDLARRILIEGATANNLKRIDVSIPLGLMVGVTGVSGSGKSSLILETLVPAIEKVRTRPNAEPGPHTNISGFESIDQIISIDQNPIGRSPRSTPATYTGIFDELRKLFAVTRDAKQRGFTAKRFGFNSGPGRCQACLGQGEQRMDMGFLSDVYVTCSHCQGTRFNRPTLQVKYKGKNIADCLQMDIDEAVTFFENIDKIYRVAACMKKVGLGYLKLGQAANTLSGGECQRIKLATELSRRETGSTLYVLDEPTNGLHLHDVNRLVTVLDALVEQGNSVIVIEHHLDVIKSCDWLIDLGPEGGRGGGYVLAEGTPEMLASLGENSTGQWLAKKLSDDLGNPRISETHP